MDSDDSFFAYHGGKSGSETDRVKKVTAKMVDILQQVNVLYENDRTINSMLTLGIQGTHVTTTASPGNTGSNQDYAVGSLPNFLGYDADGVLYVKTRQPPLRFFSTKNHC